MRHCQIQCNFMAIEDLCKLSKEYLTVLTCKYAFILDKIRKILTYYCAHLSLVVAKLTDLCSTPSQYPLFIGCHLSRPPTVSSLKITDRSFRYASPRLLNQLPVSFRQPRQSCLDSPPYLLVSSSLSSSPLSSSITPSLFHSMLKT